MRDESEKEVVHRLEAFSDVVIGFSLAQRSGYSWGVALSMAAYRVAMRKPATGRTAA